ncbi:transcriptional regulator NrdR [Myxococcota bacterium]|nr:transcriptional regulator NrdR [Myxococcota bacterium]
MRCPFCSSLDNRVVDSRLAKDGDVIRRRRECVACLARFTTHERVEEVALMVVKKDGRREPFERAKVVAGLRIACRKRPVPTDAIEKVVDDLEQRLQARGEREVGSSEIGEELMRALQALDEVAYVRFASVYRQFRDMREFRSALDKLLAERPGEAGVEGGG